MSDRVRAVRRTLRATVRNSRTLRRLARRMRTGWARAVQTALLPYYRYRLRKPIDSRLAVFATYWYRGYGCNPAAIYEAAHRMVPGLRGVWVVNRNRVHTLPPGVEHVSPGTPAYYDVLARAKVFVNNVNFPDELVKRPGTAHVMTHHGTPLKLMGFDVRGRPIPEAEIDYDGLARRCARWDYVISANRHSTEVWRHAYPGNYETLEVGYPRNDVLLRSTAADVERARDEVGIAPAKRAVLYAPTHRDNEERYVARLDLEALATRLGSEWTLLSRLHHFYEAADPSPGHTGVADVIDVASHPSIADLCLAADVLVTDYSSVMFDYAVLDRPIVIHAPDWEDYRRTRGTYFDLLEEPPGRVSRTTDELADLLLSGAAFDEGAESLRATFRARFCSLERGDASERTVRCVWSLPDPRSQRP
jgi:CDP-glycerol glycerophosphotransferase